MNGSVRSNKANKRHFRIFNCSIPDPMHTYDRNAQGTLFLMKKVKAIEHGNNNNTSFLDIFTQIIVYIALSNNKISQSLRLRL